MITVLASLAHAASCCGAMGAEPATLAPCERLAIVASSAFETDTGSWGWDGRWQGLGDDRMVTLTESFGAIGRPWNWLVLGVRVPIRISLDTVDGKPSRALRLGPAIPWARLEWAVRRDLRLGWQVGWGSMGEHDHSSEAVRANLLTFGPMISVKHGDEFGNAQIQVGLPVIGDGPATGELSLTVGRSFDEHAVGLRVDSLVASRLDAWELRTAETRLGPVYWWAITPTQRLEVAALAGIPIRYGGRSSPSTINLTATFVGGL